MKLKNSLLKTSMVLAILLITNFTFAQKFDCNRIVIRTVNVGKTNINIDNGNFVIKDDVAFTVELGTIIDNGKGSSASFAANITLNGYYTKSSKKINHSIDWTYSSSNTTIKVTDLKGSTDDPIVITEVVASIVNQCKETTKETGNFSSSQNKTSFAVLLNGLSNPDRGVCNTGKCFCLSASNTKGKVLDLGNLKVEQTLSISKEKNTSTLAYQIGFDKNSTKDFEMLERLLTWDEIQLTAEVTVTDEKGESKKITTEAKYNEKLGLHFISDQFSAGHQRTQRISKINLIFVNPANDKYNVETAYFLGYKPATSNFHVWNETWLTVQDIDDCKEIDLNKVFITESVDSKFSSVVIGLNNTKKEDPTPLELLLNNENVVVSGTATWIGGNGKTTTNELKITKTKTGNWTFDDAHAVDDSKKASVLSEIQLDFLTDCNQKISFISVYKSKVSEKSDWDYKVKMSPVANDNPVFQPTNGAQNNVLALTVPATSININSGNFIIKDNVQLNMLLSNTSNGTFDTTKINSGSISMQMSEGDGRVFWHWSFPVTTTNPKINTTFDTSKNGALTINSIEIRMVNDNLDTIVYTYKPSSETGKYGLSLDNKNYVIILEKTEKLKYNDPCKTKYKLSEISFSESTVSGLYTMKFSFQFDNKSDHPDAVEMIVQLTDCNGKTQNIKISLKYDSKTDTYTGSQAISQTKSCNWELTYGEIAAYNSCKDQTTWSFDPSKAKGNGTKNATTKTSAKPQLF